MKESNSTPEHKLTHSPETHRISAKLPAQSAYQTFIQPLFAGLYRALMENSKIETEKQSFKCLLMTVKTAGAQNNIRVRKYRTEK